MKNLFFSLKNENKKKIDTKKHYSNKTNEILFNDLFNNLKINECKKIDTHSGKKNNNFDSNNKTIITNTINNVSKNVNTFPIPTTQKIGNKKIFQNIIIINHLIIQLKYIHKIKKFSKILTKGHPTHLLCINMNAI